MVELPLTMPQDHTLFEILKHRDIHVWKEKAAWIAEQGGLVLINIHPDYMIADDRLALFEELLVYMKSLKGMWHTHPRDIARWWQDRNRSALDCTGGSPAVTGPAAGRALLVRHALRNGNVTTITPSDEKS